MATQETQETPTAGTEAPAEGAPAAEVDPSATPATEAPPAEGAPAAETPAAPETPEAKAAAEAKEGELKIAAEKYAKEQISLANRTMAAARRAEKAIEPVKTENATLKREVEVLGGFVDQLKTKPMEALARLGFPTFRAFAEHVSSSGGEKQQTEEERIQALVDARLEAREQPSKKAAQEAAVAAARDAVFKTIDEQKAKYPLTATRLGKSALWEEIITYHDKYGEVPDGAVFYLADQVEAAMRADLGDNVSARPAAQQGNPATGAAAPGASTSGKTLAGKSPSSAPAPRRFDPNEDDDARRKRIAAELKSEGFI